MDYSNSILGQLWSKTDPYLDYNGKSVVVRHTNGWAPFLGNMKVRHYNETDPKSDLHPYGGEWHLINYLSEALNFKAVCVFWKH